MQAHILKGTGEQFGYARLLQQGSLVFKPNFNAHDVVRLIDDDLVLLWCQKSPCALSFSLGYRPIGFMSAFYQNQTAPPEPYTETHINRYACRVPRHCGYLEQP